MKAIILTPNYMDIRFLVRDSVSDARIDRFIADKIKEAAEKEPYEGRTITKTRANVLTDAELEAKIREAFEAGMLTGNGYIDDHDVVRKNFASDFENYKNGTLWWHDWE